MQAFDKNGQPLQVGDTVTLTLVITSIHTHPPERPPQIGLERLLPDGQQILFSTCDATWVQKAPA